MKIILARKILPVSSPPFSNGAVCIKDGVITDIGPRASVLRKYPRAKVADLGGLLLMPGLVNAHTHVELSNLYGKVDVHGGFFEWISKLIEQRRSMGTAGLEKASTRALGDALRSGTTCIGDISSTEAAVPAIVRSGLRARVYLEIIGLDDTSAEKTFNRLKTRLKQLAALSDRITTGISPHSTYSVSGLLYDKISSYISQNPSTLTVHLSENIDEVRHIKGQRSRIDGYHSMLGWDAYGKNKARSPLELLIDKGLGKGLTAVHAVHVSSRDIKLMAANGISVAHCPRSNHLLGVGKAPAKRMVEGGVNVAIGTDSLASNIDIDMWEEMRFAYLVNSLSPETVIRMATIGGARALGLDDVTGALEPGKAADMIAVSGDAARASNPYGPLLYQTRSGNIMMSMVGGRLVHRAEGFKVSI